MWKVDYDKFNTSREELIAHINEKCDEFLHSSELNDIAHILGTDIDGIGNDYNARKREDGTTIEPQMIGKNEDLERYRSKLYPLFDGLGFYKNNETKLQGYNRIAVLGGTLNAGFYRTGYAKRFTNSNVATIDGLTCYRPINPVEREGAAYHANSDTEFGALSEAFVNVFELDNDRYLDDFTTNRNINSVTNIRTFEEGFAKAKLSLYACPSLEPDIRRANTGDCIRFYIENNTFGREDKVLFITNSRYYIRQFLQIIYYMLKTSVIFPYDLVGFTNPDCRVTEDTVNLSYDVQELIAIIDWVNRFKEEYT